jgi:UDP-MurNAc hydroxylase
MDGPIVTALGHAGLSIAAPGVRVLADPWLSGGGAFLGSWFPFPDNSGIGGPAAWPADVVVISHEHLDHLDLALIASLPDWVPVVVPRYPSTILELRIAQAGHHNVVALEPWERFPLAPGRNDWLTVIPEQCPMSHDAAVLVRLAGRTILHANDARMTLPQIRRAVIEAGAIDVMGVQMSGASWHPVCYEYEGADLERITTLKRTGKFRAVTRLVRAVKPGLVLPYAGPPCFLDPTLRHLNGGLTGPGIFPDQADALLWLRTHLPDQPSEYLLPGDAVDLRHRHIEREGTGRDGPLPGRGEARGAYLAAYAERRADQIQRAWDENPEPPDDSSLAEAFTGHMEALGTLSSYFLARIGMVLRFEVEGPGGGTWDAHIGPDRVEVDLDGAAPTVDYRLRLESRWLAGVATGRTRWEELLLSLRFSARREPDRYNDYLVGLLKHADRAALHAVEKYEAARDPGATIEVTVQGQPRRISRYCPHAGEDLALGAVIEGTTIRCLGHNFEFDLGTGACLNAKCDPLVVSEPVHVPRQRGPEDRGPEGRGPDTGRWRSTTPTTNPAVSRT